MTSNPHSSPVETTAGDSGTTSYIGVIRGADEADECAHTALSLIYRRERDEARDEAGRLRAELAEVTGNSLHTVAKYWRERQALRVEVSHLTAKWEEVTLVATEQSAIIDIQDATIERLTYDRNHPYGDPVQAADDRRSP
jgi:hypothetical protein